jgi:hypothetical protein
VQSPDGRERGKTDFEQLLEHFFHAFDHDADDALSNKELFEVLKSLGFNYSEHEVEEAFAKFLDLAENKDRPIDKMFFKDFWMSCSYHDPLKVRNQDLGREVVESCGNTEYHQGLYDFTSRHRAAQEQADFEHQRNQLMLRNASEARSVWQEFGSNCAMLDKLHVRMLLTDLGMPDCSAAATERIMQEMDRNELGLVFFEDFISWFMIHTARIYQAYQDKRTLQLKRQETIHRQRTMVQLGTRPCSSADNRTTSSSPSSPAISAVSPPVHLMSLAATPIDLHVGMEDILDNSGHGVEHMSRHHPQIEMPEDEVRGIFEELFSEQCGKKHVAEYTVRAVSFVKALLNRTPLSQHLQCPDREKMLIAYDAMRPKPGVRIDLDCFLNYYGPKGRLSTGRRSDHKPSSLSGLLAILE